MDEYQWVSPHAHKPFRVTWANENIATWCSPTTWQNKFNHKPDSRGRKIIRQTKNLTRNQKLELEPVISAPVLWGWAGSLSFLIRNFFHLFPWTLFFITIQSYVPELENRVLEEKDGAGRNCPPAHIHVPDWVPDQQYLVMEHGLVVKPMLVENTKIANWIH